MVFLDAMDGDPETEGGLLSAFAGVEQGGAEGVNRGFSPENSVQQKERAALFQFIGQRVRNAFDSLPIEQQGIRMREASLEIVRRLSFLGDLMRCSMSQILRVVDEVLDPSNSRSAQSKAA